MGTQWMRRKSQPERTVEQAWEYLSNAFASAGDSARSTGRRSSRLADRTAGRVGSAADEAWSRANAAVDALAGRRPQRPWAWILGASLVGVAVGWAASATRAAASRPSVDDRVVFVDADRTASNRVGLDR